MEIVQLKSIRFLNCEWGISPEEAIAALNEELADIDIIENIKLKQQDKAMGMRVFIAYDFQFADYKWRLKLIFLDNKLANVLLSSRDADKLKIIEELEAKFGEYETFMTIMEEWKAKDGSHLELITVTSPSEQIIMSFWGSGFYEEYQKRKR